VLNLDDHGLDIVGHINSGLPSFGLPDVTGDAFIDLVGGAIGVMLVGFAEGLGAAKTYAARGGYDIDANKELLGLGVANVGSGLASGMVVNGSLSKTAVNGSAGAKSQLSPLTAAVLTLVTLLFLTGIFEKLPEETLAAIVVRRRRRARGRRVAAPAVAGAARTPGPRLPSDQPGRTSSAPSPRWSAC
jgi:MFS superfamily sulfate permease-like transporter